MLQHSGPIEWLSREPMKFKKIVAELFRPFPSASDDFRFRVIVMGECAD